MYEKNMQNQKHLMPAGKLYSIWLYWKKSDLDKRLSNRKNSGDRTSSHGLQLLS